MDKEQLKRVVKGQFNEMLEEIEAKSEEIEKKLETLRKKLVKDGQLVKSESIGDALLGGSKPNKRIQLKTVSELVETPINELVLYFIRNYKNQNERKLIEYHLGEVWFFEEI